LPRPGRTGAIFCSIALCVMASTCFAQDKPAEATTPSSTTSTAPTQASVGATQDPVPDTDAGNTQQPANPKRILGIIPNFQTTNDKTLVPKPLTPKEKYVLAYHQMFDISAHIGNVLQAVIQQASDGQPHYGEGWGAFGERFAAAEGDQYTSSFFIYGFLPHILHDDPRYFRRGQGSPLSRIWYAMTRTVITRTDAQTPTFNAPQVFGQLAQAGISNVYYPRPDRNIGSTFEGWGINLGYNTGYNVLKEFYPDFLHALRRHSKDPGSSPPPARP
jgi:hypothetical protein